MLLFYLLFYPQEKKKLLDAEFYKTHCFLTDETLENGAQMKNNNSFIHYSQRTKILKILCTALIYDRYYNVQIHDDTTQISILK